MALSKYKVTSKLYFGKWWCIFLPHDKLEMTTVVGKAIELPLIEDPTNEDVEKYHQMYMDALQDLFNRNKAKYAAEPDAQLEMF